MQVFRFVPFGRYGMNINIENPRLQQGELGHAAFFLRFPARGFQQRIIGIIGVASGLKPAVELGMVDEQHLRMVGRDHPSRSGEVALEGSALPKGVICLYKSDGLAYKSSFGSVKSLVSAQFP